MSEKSSRGCKIDELVFYVQKSVDWIRDVYAGMLKLGISGIRFEGFDSRKKGLITVDISFEDKTAKSSFDFLNMRVYKRFTYNRDTKEMISLDTP